MPKDLAHCLLPTLGSFLQSCHCLSYGYISLRVSKPSRVSRDGPKSVPNTIWELSQLVPANSHRLHLSRGRCFPAL